ncbi:hypothetical protein pEaSNUABM17_00252 [Erwinia phage pEa_SNUABM_17]|uniref:Uncharacterized protein n=1 Tax=Erwinia phage pEa_SNUABM_17 TaxID=2869545 RepID=A0AAE7XLF9_9CAUD|nr:hypothetical protein MPK72_gp252 [Erwinia phage pEa_SNUABM_17]QZE57798.1 hypothetical protein pEaSNUABM17_00252 [Erwinia phage pEa_SNUABM_17]
MSNKLFGNTRYLIITDKELQAGLTVVASPKADTDTIDGLRLIVVYPGTMGKPDAYSVCAVGKATFTYYQRVLGEYDENQPIDTHIHFSDVRQIDLTMAHIDRVKRFRYGVHTTHEVTDTVITRADRVTTYEDLFVPVGQALDAFTTKQLQDELTRRCA